MNGRIIALVFRKEGRELLRDRRTIFVNVVLPVLLYPILALFAIQVVQLTRPTAADVPRIATIDLPLELVGHIPTPEDVAATEAGEADITSLEQTLRPTVATAELRAAVDALLALPLDPPTEPDAALPDGPRQRALQALREAGLVAAVAWEPLPQEGVAPGDRIRILIDNAHRKADQVRTVLRRSLTDLRELRVADRLAEAGLAAHLTDPLASRTFELAPPAEASRSRWAGVIPLLLVFMALSGAFYPALDLIAGERERGTLESLLSWPGSRSDIFLGKLLVVICAGIVSVVLNLASIGVTAGIVNQQLTSQGSGAPAVDLSFGLGILALCFVALLPLVIMLAAVSLALAGMAASYKEAQNYLSPLLLAVMVPAMLAMAPNATPSIALDLVPVVGPILALKASLQEPTLPWLHVLLATVASTGLAAVVVTWSVRLLDSERFLYPGLVRAGWGRFRRWGPKPRIPGGLEVIGLFAITTGAFLGGGALFADAGPALQVVGPLLLCILLPALLHAWLGAYPWREHFHLHLPRWRAWPLTLLLVPVGLALSISIGQLHGHLLGEMPPGLIGFDVVGEIHAVGGIGLLLACLALAPAVSEELLCRGPLLRGLVAGLGPIGGILLSSFCFAVLHGSPWRLFPQLALGIVLAVLVWRCRSIWPAILLHAGHNALAVLADPVAGLVDGAWLEARLADLGSGSWTIVLAVAGLAATGILWLVPRSGQGPVPAADRTTAPAETTTRP